MIARFEKDKWYLFKGNKTNYWNGSSLMDGVLDGKPHKCIRANASNGATFDCAPHPNGGLWYWDHLENWYLVNTQQEDLL